MEHLFSNDHGEWWMIFELVTALAGFRFIKPMTESLSRFLKEE